MELRPNAILNGHISIAFQVILGMNSFDSALAALATGLHRRTWMVLLLFSLIVRWGFPTVCAQEEVFQRWDTVAVFDAAGEQLNHPWSGGLTAPQLSMADLDGDGVRDVFVFDRSGNRILVFQGCLPAEVGSPPTYHHRPDWRSRFPTALRNWALLRDANCDGTPDLFVNSQSGVRIWYGDAPEGQVMFDTPPASNVIANWDFGTGDQQLPMVCLSTDIPALGDFDGDGDLDMVTWTETSSTLYSYAGRGATEESLGCGDTLIWDVTNRCYGMLDEASEDNTVFIGPEHECGFNVADPRLEEAGEESLQPMRHAGGTTALLELDGDGHLDLLLGDVSYNQFVACYMQEAVDGQDSTTHTTDIWPADLGSEDTLDIQRFPAAFHEDIDQDGVRDLLVAANATFEVDGQNGSWWYRNVGSEESPEWMLQTTAFLQEDMIDLGRGAYPVFTDFNGDGLIDLVASNKERYLGPGNTPSMLSRYKNIGTAEAPAFEQLDTNWLSLPDLGLESVIIEFGDLDGDGDEDLIIGDELGNLHRWENVAGAGNPMELVLAEAAMSDAEGVAIDVGQFAAPNLCDLDGDGDLDLIVGEKNGNLNLFENTGGVDASEFSLVTQNAGQVLADNLLGINGFATPEMWPTDTGLVLVLGNELGRLQLFDCPANLLAEPEAEWPEITDQWLDIYDGEFAAPAGADLDSDGFRDLAVGVRDGGITLWNGHAESYAALGCTPPVVDGVDEALFEDAMTDWLPAPNPLQPGGAMKVPCTLQVFDLLGRPMGALNPQNGSVVWPWQWPAGTYLVQPLGPECETGAPSIRRSARRLVVLER